MSQFKNATFKSKITQDSIGKNVRRHDGRSSIKDLGAGDSFYVHDFIDPQEAATIFSRLLHEVDFVPMFNVSKDRSEIWPIPRLVSAQTYKSKCESPIYRMPGCNQANISTMDWSATVREVCERAEKAMDAKLNHCVCTLYRNKNDSLGFHKDKVLDLAERSSILSISFGAARPIQFFEAGGKRRHVIVLQPGSLLAIGPETNTCFEHGIPKLKSDVDPRISLSVRQSSSYVDSNSGKIVGKGDAYQTGNYPFIESFDDSKTYSDESQLRMKTIQNEAAKQLADLRARF